MSKAQPIVFLWSADEVVMRPSARYLRACAAFEDGAEYVLAEVESRNMRFHNACFAELHSAYLNLPESLHAFPTEEHFRKWLLIQEGWCTIHEFTVSDPEERMRIATYMRIKSPYARIKVDGDMIIVREAMSQSPGAMKKEDFEASMKDILALAASMLGVPLGSLKREAVRST